MQARDGWRALQQHLGAARAAAVRGDREVALAEVGAALAIDPNFLAAQTLRDRLANGELPSAVPRAPAATPYTSAAPHPPAVRVASAAPAEPKPARDVSPESYAKFQQRARERRLETRVEAARQSILGRRLNDAAAALDEVIELSPGHPALPALTAEFDVLRRRLSTSHRGPWAAAGAVFIATTFGASYVQDSSWLVSRPVMTAAVLMPAAESTVAAANTRAAGTTGEIAGIAAPEQASAAVMPRDSEGPSIDALPAARASQPEPPPATAAQVEPLSLHVQTLPLPPPPAEAVHTPPPVSVSPALQPVRQTFVVDESVLVQKALQRYRSAYEELDVESARAAWPAVNGAALARAFEELESQTLTFDACDVQVTGDAATATCRGSARYVPKVGSRAPHVEPRVWNFTLKKTAGDWTIDSARTQR